MSSSAGKGLPPDATTRVGEPLRRVDTCNIVIFGETGAGKSSLVNLITGGRVEHEISPDALGRTTETTVYDHEIALQGRTLKLKLFDTPGLGEGSEGKVPAAQAQKILKKLLQNLKEGDQIHLLVYCVRSVRKTTALRRNYDLFHSKLEEVPVVLVITGLEHQRPDMEEWWTKNEKFLSDQQMTFVGHVCITALTLRDDDDSCVKKRYGQSYHAVCELIERHSPPSGKGCRASMSTKNIVLFGGIGAGKSSVVNLMAGQEKARTSPDIGRCTLQWQEHPVTFDGLVYKVFDTVGLEEPQLGTDAYLDIIVDAYNLIRKLKNEGGIDLLLYCVRAGPVTSTLQTSYRLFYEWLCENKVPIVLILTGLENEQNMEDWWTRNEHIFSKYQIHVHGHACITAANHLDGRHRRLYEESRSLVRHLVVKHTQGGGGAWNGGEGLLTRFIRKLKELLRGNPKTKDVIGVLTDRCGMPLSTAKALVRKVV